MNINDSPEQARFRAEVRDWIARDVPPHAKNLRQGIVQGAGPGKAVEEALEAALALKGWQTPSIPAEHGGAGFSLLERVIFEEELTDAGVPYLYSLGRELLCPILSRYGTPEQRERWLIPTIRGELTWAQGYSEPGAGSDLANLQLRAERRGDEFVLNGQKIWTSMAHVADWIFLLVRTDPNAARKQEGISFLLVDLHSPGVTVRPLITIDDHHHFNETFFEDVRVPADQLVGELNQGWTVAKALLGHERFTHPTANPTIIGRTLENVKEAARRTPANGGVAWDDVGLRRRVAALEMDTDCMRYTRFRSLTLVAKGEAPGPETMIFKLLGSELTQVIVELHQLVEGPAGITWGDEPFGPLVGEPANHAANIRGATIRGGTSEVQRNVVSKRVLRLPD